MPSVRHAFGHAAFRLARSRRAGRLFWWSVLRVVSWWPVDRLDETERVIAFRHPRPSYPTHIVIVLKSGVPGLFALDTRNAELIAELFASAQRLVRRFRLEQTGYRLILNGGAYQDVPLLHIHLVSGSAPPDTQAGSVASPARP